MPYGPKPKPVGDRFWPKVERTDGCWLWRGATTLRGYGTLGVGSMRDGTRRHAMAHRVSYEIHFGPIPDGLFVCHSCDNPPCVNPAHLFLGTPAQNTADMHAKGRGVVPVSPAVSGEQVSTAKLTTAQAIEIRQLYDAGGGLRGIAGKFGISRAQVCNIGRRKAWRSLPEQANPEQAIAIMEGLTK